MCIESSRKKKRRGCFVLVEKEKIQESGHNEQRAIGSGSKRAHWTQNKHKNLPTIKRAMKNTKKIQKLQKQKMSNIQTNGRIELWVIGFVIQ